MQHQTRTKELLQRKNSVIYTDEFKINLNNIKGLEAGVTILKNDLIQSKEFKLSNKMSILDAELYAIHRALI